MRILTLLIALCLFFPATLYAQEPDQVEGMVEYSDEAELSEDAEPIAGSPNHLIRRIENEFWYIVLLSGLCVSTLLIVLSFLRHKTHSAKDIVNATGLTLIIFGTIILVMVVNTSEQLTAAIGILGAIAGYLFRSVQDTGGDNNSST